MSAVNTPPALRGAVTHREARTLCKVEAAEGYTKLQVKQPFKFQGGSESQTSTGWQGAACRTLAV